MKKGTGWARKATNEIRAREIEREVPVTDAKTNKWKDIAFGAVGFIFLIIIVLLVFKHLWGLLLTIDKEISATIIATSGTVLVAVATLIYNQRRAKEREIAEAHRDRKVEIYDEFMKMIVDILLHTKEQDNNPDLPELPDSFEDFFYKFTRESIVWASPEIVQGWNSFRDASRAGEEHIILLIDDILREIRRDLGNSNKGLKRGDLIRLFLSDPENLDQLSSGN